MPLTVARKSKRFSCWLAPGLGSLLLHANLTVRLPADRLLRSLDVRRGVPPLMHGPN